jgi:hypothetical protein
MECERVSVPQGKVPIFESVRGAFAETRSHAVALAPAALAAAVAVALLNFAAINTGLAVNPLGQILLSILSGLGMALFIAPAIRASLGEPATVSAQSVALSLKLFAAMVVIGFFLTIVFLVAAIPGLIVVGMTFAPFQSELEAANGDVQASMELLQKVFSANAGPLLAVILVDAAVWMALTSRLYLCAPASVAENRVATFETWRWTQGNLLRISAARLLTLIPAALATTLIQAAVTSLLGVSASDPAKVAAIAAADPVRFAIAGFITSFVSLVIYGGCEAALSTYLYRGLKPPT